MLTELTQHFCASGLVPSSHLRPAVWRSPLLYTRRQCHDIKRSRGWPTVVERRTRYVASSAADSCSSRRAATIGVSAPQFAISPQLVYKCALDDHISANCEPLIRAAILEAPLSSRRLFSGFLTPWGDADLRSVSKQSCAEPDSTNGRSCFCSLFVAMLQSSMSHFLEFHREDFF